MLIVGNSQFKGGLMKSDIEKKISARVAAAFEDVVIGMSTKARNDILSAAENIVREVWFGKIYVALLVDKIMVGEYFLDAELEQFLNEAVEECHKAIELIAEMVRREFNR